MLALPLLGASPRPRTATAVPPPASGDVYGVRVLSRADEVVAQASPGSSPAASSVPTATATPVPGPAPSPAVVSAARAEFEAWQAGKIDLNRYIPEARAQFTDSAVGQISSQYLRPLGAVKTFSFVRQLAVQGMTVYEFRAACANGSIDELISWNSAGKVQFIFFRPPQ